MKTLTRTLAVATVVVAAACAKNQPKTAVSPSVSGAVPAKPSGGAGPDVSLDPALTVATVDGVPITAGEVDEKIGDDMDSATLDYVNKVHDMREQELEELVDERLVDMEAKARGIDSKVLIKQEIQDKVKPPSEQELRQAFDTIVKPSRPDLKFEDVKTRLSDELTQEEEQRRAKAFLDELKAKYHVKTSLPLAKVPRVEVAATGPAVGPKSAKVTIVEFSDFQCPFCQRATETVKQVEQAYGNQVRVVYRYFPLPFHSHAMVAAEAGACADQQGKFWAMHDSMFANQDQLDPAGLKKQARAAGLDGAKFDKCLDSEATKATVQKDLAAGKAAHVNGTPAFFINGRPLSGAQPFSAFKEIIDAELAAK